MSDYQVMQVSVEVKYVDQSSDTYFNFCVSIDEGLLNTLKIIDLTLPENLFRNQPRSEYIARELISSLDKIVIERTNQLKVMQNGQT